MTPSERHALLFFAGVALLGGGVRLHRASRAEARSAPGDRTALEHQIAEVDLARERGRSSRASRRQPRPPKESVFPAVLAPIDLDTAPAESLERLPRIGPALATRIVADRDSLGPFGSLEGFQRVKGVGPGMARTLAPYVTFSGTPRPSPVGARVSTRRRVSFGEPRSTGAPP